MSDSKKIYQQIAKIMAEVPAIGKNKQNTQQGFKFRGIDDVYNAVQPLFAKYGVFPVMQQIGVMNRVEGQTKSGGTMHRMCAVYDVHFYAEDGSFVTVRLEAEGMDSADKGTNKCHSVAHKYALLTLLMIPTEDLAEPDAHTPEPATFKQAQQPTPKLPADILKKLNTVGSDFYGKDWDAKRKDLVLHVTNGAMESSTDLTPDEANRLISGIEKKIADRAKAEQQKEKQIEDIFGLTPEGKA